MRIIAFSRIALSAVAAASLVAGCGAPFPLRQAQGDTEAQGDIVLQIRAARSKTFDYTGGEQTFTVPKGVTQLRVVASGAGSPSSEHFIGGNGGLVKATIPVKSGQKLAIYVGGAGQAGASGSGGLGGFNGGGDGGAGSYQGSTGDSGMGGGGASDVRQGGTLASNRVIVAGGGGGAGGAFCYSNGSCYSNSGDGGAGGGGDGQSGRGGVSLHKCSNCYYPGGGGGKGGTQTEGGKGGRGGESVGSSGFLHAARGHHGSLEIGGAGGCCKAYSGMGGGGAGGGYYGGGGGGAGGFFSSGPGGGGGGGGGSSYIETSATHVKNLRGAGSSGNGQIVISW
jgi:hypothetical protein